jgi:hypothetical protein
MATSGWSIRPPVDCARSREIVKRSELAGFAEYGYRASHSRLFWGLRLQLVCTLHCLPVGSALTVAEADARGRGGRRTCHPGGDPCRAAVAPLAGAAVVDWVCPVFG